MSKIEYELEPTIPKDEDIQFDPFAKVEEAENGTPLPAKDKSSNPPLKTASLGAEKAQTNETNVEDHLASVAGEEHTKPLYKRKGIMGAIGGFAVAGIATVGSLFTLGGGSSEPSPGTESVRADWGVTPTQPERAAETPQTTTTLGPVEQAQLNHEFSPVTPSPEGGEAWVGAIEENLNNYFLTGDEDYLKYVYADGSPSRSLPELKKKLAADKKVREGVSKNYIRKFKLAIVETDDIVGWNPNDTWSDIRVKITETTYDPWIDQAKEASYIHDLVLRTKKMAIDENGQTVMENIPLIYEHRSQGEVES